MEIATEPVQPAEVERRLADLVAAAPPAPDPWWQAGIDEALDQ